MKRLIAAAGVEMVVTCAAFAAAAKTSNSIERCLRMVTDAVRNDVRTAAVGDTSARSASLQRSHRVRSRRRPHAKRCREGRASEIFGCASNNRYPIDR